MTYRRKYDDTVESRVVEMRENGFSYYKISTETGIPMGSITTILRRKGKLNVSKKCDHCGKRIGIKDAAFCPYCGKDITAPIGKALAGVKELYRYGIELPQNERDLFKAILDDIKAQLKKVEG